MRYLSVEIGQDECGIPLEQVREVVGFPTFTPLPNSPKYVIGLMNLRDQVLPLIDLRIRLGIVPTLTHDTSVVICTFEEHAFGVVVDTIHSVNSPEENQVLPVESMAIQQNDQMEIIKSVVRNPEGLTLVFDMSKILSANEMIFFKLDSLKKDLQQAS